LENLLRNARNTQDYDLNQVLNQTLDFLFSERGSFIRNNLVDEIVKGVDLLGKNALYNVTYALRDRLVVNEVLAAPEPSNNKHWSISNGFGIFSKKPQVTQLAPHISVAAEARGSAYQQVASRLAQRTIARLIREVLISKKRGEKQGKS